MGLTDKQIINLVKQCRGNNSIDRELARAMLYEHIKKVNYDNIHVVVAMFSYDITFLFYHINGFAFLANTFYPKQYREIMKKIDYYRNHQIRHDFEFILSDFKDIIHRADKIGIL